MKLVRGLAAIAAALLLQACAVARQPGVPALRVTAPNGAASVLIGSLHIAADGLVQPSPTLLHGAKHYVIEGLPGPYPDRFVAIAPLVEQRKSTRADWADSVTEPQFDELVRRLTCNPMPLLGASPLDQARVVLALDSAMFAPTAAINHCASPGLLSRDLLLLLAAKQRGLVAEGLETFTEANKQRADLPERIYRHTFYTAFTPASKQALRRAIHGLNSGAYEEVTAALRDLAASSADADLLDRVMIVERNHTWMPRLVKYLEDGQAVINVGAAHLPGPHGVIEMLRRRGFQVEPILVPAAGSTGIPE